MKTKTVETITSNEDEVRLRIFDGEIPIDAAGAELIRMYKEQAAHAEARRRVAVDMRVRVTAERDRLAAALTWHDMKLAPRDGTHILAKFSSSPPTTVHWFEDRFELGGSGIAGWYLSVQQSAGAPVLPIAWQHLADAAPRPSIAAAIRKGE